MLKAKAKAQNEISNRYHVKRLRDDRPSSPECQCGHLTKEEAQKSINTVIVAAVISTMIYTLYAVIGYHVIYGELGEHFTTRFISQASWNLMAVVSLVGMLLYMKPITSTQRVAYLLMMTSPMIGSLMAAGVTGGIGQMFLSLSFTLAIERTLLHSPILHHERHYRSPVADVGFGMGLGGACVSVFGILEIQPILLEGQNVSRWWMAILISEILLLVGGLALVGFTTYTKHKTDCIHAIGRVDGDPQ